MPTKPDGGETIQKNLTKQEEPIKSNAIEELKSKIVNREVDAARGTSMIPDNHSTPTHRPAQVHLSEDGLIVPRKPPNPVKENSERQNLHKELMFNQKIGKNVLNQKTELQKALAKQKDNLARKEMEHNEAAKTHELEKVIADRAKRLQPNTIEAEEDKVINKEFLQARMKLKNRCDSK